MIFLSHNKADKPIVEIIAIRLASIFGQENIFYDSWSMQPGDGIIDKMNEGLNTCTHFFFFISKNSLNSNFVKLEWQNALYKETKLPTSLKFVGLKLDDVEIPDLLSQKIYIDIYSSGIEPGIAQIIDVINGKNTFKPTLFNNIAANVTYKSSKEITIECYVRYYLEPSCRFALFFNNILENLIFSCDYDSFFTSGINEWPIQNLKFQFIAVQRALTLEFPFLITVKSDVEDIKFIRIKHAYSQNDFRDIPTEIKDF